jgi:uracil-DNA glycosylase
MYWDLWIGKEFQTDYFQKIKTFLSGKSYFPEYKDIFSAFYLTPFTEIKVVILRQNPYYTKDMAHGLAFSVPKDIKKKPPSLKNILKELHSGIVNIKW